MAVMCISEYREDVVVSKCVLVGVSVSHVEDSNVG